MDIPPGRESGVNTRDPRGCRGGSETDPPPAREIMRDIQDIRPRLFPASGYSADYFLDPANIRGINAGG